MSNPASFVTGQKYQAAPRDAHGYEPAKWMIFFPEYQLNIDSDGIIEKVEAHFTTFLGQQAEWKISLQLRDLSRKEQTKMRKEFAAEAEKKAITEVQIPRETVEKIKSIYEQQLKLKEESSQIAGALGLPKKDEFGH